MSCSQNTTLFLDLPSDLAYGSHAIKAKIAVTRFDDNREINNYNLRCSYNNEQLLWSGTLSYPRESWFFENAFTNPCELYGLIKDKINLKPICDPNMQCRVSGGSGCTSWCHCGGKLGPMDAYGCVSYACYKRDGSSGPCTSTLNEWSYGTRRLDFNQIKDYILGKEHTDFDYYDYISDVNTKKVETTENLTVGIGQSNQTNKTCENIYFTCWDNSKILQYTCVNNANVITSNKCPVSPPSNNSCIENENCKTNEKCQDNICVPKSNWFINIFNMFRDWLNSLFGR
jgi:hypothetical protein